MSVQQWMTSRRKSRNYFNNLMSEFSPMEQSNGQQSVLFDKRTLKRQNAIRRHNDNHRERVQSTGRHCAQPLCPVTATSEPCKDQTAKTLHTDIIFEVEKEEEIPVSVNVELNHLQVKHSFNTLIMIMIELIV